MQKLIDCLYLGQTTVNKKENVSLTDLIELLEVDMLLARDSSSTSNSSAEDSEEDVPKTKKIVRSKNKGSSSSSEQDSSSEDEIPAKASKKATPRPKSKMLNNKNSKTDDELLKKKAEEDKAKIRLERLEEKDVKKYMKKEDSPDPSPPIAKPHLAPNPFHKGTPPKSTPQKRRLNDSDKKVISKASKKARQEDDSSADDSDLEEAKSARKKELPASVNKVSRSRKSSESSVEENKASKVPKNNVATPGPASSKKKVGPKSKLKPGPASQQKNQTGPNNSSIEKEVQSRGDLTKNSNVKKTEEKEKNNSTKSKMKAAVNSIVVEDENTIKCCDICDSILVSNAAFEKHMKEKHGKSLSEESDDATDATTTDGKESPEPVKKSAQKLSSELQRRRRRSTSSESTDVDRKPSDKDQEKSSKKIQSKGPKRPGPKSKSSVLDSDTDSDQEESKTKVKKKSPFVPRLSPAKPKKAGPASASSKPGPASKAKAAKVDKNGLSISEQAAKQLLETSDSETDSSIPSLKPVESESEQKKKISPKPKLSVQDRRPSVSSNGLNCRFCTESKDKASNLKNHVLNHIKDQLFKELPTCTPFLCPECKTPSRDKITLLRHYAFGHRKAFSFISEEDFKPREKGHPIREVPKGRRQSIENQPSKIKKEPKTPNLSSKARRPDSTKKEPSSSPSCAKKVRKSPDKDEVSSDSDKDIPKKKSATFEVTVKDKVAENGGSAGAASGALFSSDSEDGWESSAKKSKEAAMKSFDDLLNDSAEKKEEEPQEKKNGDSQEIKDNESDSA